MIKIDFWSGYSLQDVDTISIFFYPNDGQYRGNLYKDGKAIGDFTSNDSVQLEKMFPGIFSD